MKAQFDIEMIFKARKVRNELEYERALIVERKLRLLARENSKLKVVRMQLRALLEKYEQKNWASSSDISEKQMEQSDLAELIAEKERAFLMRRKELIKRALKRTELKQQDLMLLLGHRSKTYMSELMNGIVPFTLNDLVVINRLLKIDLADLVPTTLSHDQREKIKKSIEAIGTKKIVLGSDDFDLAFT